MTILPSLFLSLSLGLAIGLGLEPGDHVQISDTECDGRHSTPSCHLPQSGHSLRDTPTFSNTSKGKRDGMSGRKKGWRGCVLELARRMSPSAKS